MKKSYFPFYKEKKSRDCVQVSKEVRHRFYLKKSGGTGYLGFATCWENTNKDTKKP